MAGTASGSGLPPERIRVLVVDDDADMRFVLCQLVGSRDGWKVVGEACDGATALPAVQRLKPDIVVLDLVMPTRGDAVLPDLLKAAPSCMVVMFSGEDAADQRARLIGLGAFAYYEKTRITELPDRLAADFNRFRIDRARRRGGSLSGPAHPAGGTSRYDACSARPACQRF